MARNKAKDDVYFNCSQEHELNHVADQYGIKSHTVKEFLIQACKQGKIKYKTHYEVYKLIRDELGYPIPN